MVKLYFGPLILVTFRKGGLATDFEQINTHVNNYLSDSHIHANMSCHIC
jgi:hypothetical protein